MGFSVTILGSSSATPTKERNPSAQIVSYNDNLYLVDCGEGTQMQMLKHGIKSRRINHIFISHLHGDHYLGLIGLLFTYHLMGRVNDLFIYAPHGLKDIIYVHLQAAQSTLSYNINFIELLTNKQEVIFVNNDLEVSCFNLKHRIDTFGFLFKEKPKEPKIKKESIDFYKLSFDQIKDIKKGVDIIDFKGHTIPKEKLIEKALPLRSFAYCSDTAYYENIIPLIKHVDILYHEATFTEALKQTAQEKFHSTALEAALIAKKAGVKKLIIGHYSARYTDLNPLLNEATAIFPNTYLGLEGETHFLK